MERIKKLIIQMIKFGGVGAFCYVIDFALLYLLTKLFGDSLYLLFAGISFTVSMIINYILCVKFVFDVNDKHSKGQHFVMFMVFSVIGLGLTELLMWLGVSIIGISVLITKVLATIIVMIYNFITKKLSLEKY